MKDGKIEPDKAMGSWLISKDGKKYLDYTSGIGVLNLGHCHEKVKTAVEKQLASFWHTSNMFENSNQEKTASLITEASGLDHVFFCNSGAEANEAAIKLARKATGKNKIITLHSIVPWTYICNDGSNRAGKSQNRFRKNA